MSAANIFSQEWFMQEAQKPEYEEIKSVADHQREEFLDRFAYEKLDALDDENILSVMFQSEKKTDENMCSYLLSQKTSSFVGVGQGSMHQFLLFYDYGRNKRKKSNPGETGWTTGASASEKKISQAEALELAKKIRDGIVSIAKYIASVGKEDPTKIDYNHLQQLFKEYGFNENQRFIKYYAISFPKIIPVFYNSEWHIRLFSLLDMSQSGNFFTRLGQIATYVYNTGIDPIVFANIIFNNTDQFHIFKTWKISHGILSDENRKDLLERQMIAMSKSTGALGRSKKTQGDSFSQDLKKGDYIYLCYDNIIRLIGMIDDDSPKLNTNLGDDWVERHYKIIKTSIKDEQYTGKTKRWAPNNNSTFVEVPTSDFLTFEHEILLPFFGLKLKDLFMKKPNDYISSKDKKGQDRMKKSNECIQLNTVLYGPPGTGKTYNAVIYAVAICENEEIDVISAKADSNYKAIKDKFDQLVKDGRIVFTTFHQSYGYEEFIEGIKPYTDNDTSELKYRIEPGVFLCFCENDIQDSSNSKDSFEVSWQKLEEKAYETDKKYQFTRSTGSKFIAELMENGFRVTWSSGTYNTLQKSVIKEQWANKIKREELTGGNVWAYDARQAIINEMYKHFGLLKYVEDTHIQKDKNKVFIIDEINRGNVSKIFGELITLIEDTKRKGMVEEASAILPYSRKLFSVPNNVYILGTMNTADRSIATLDTALRRRFHFIEMQPKPELLAEVEVEGLSIRKMLERMNDKISILFDREHTIGHSFFMPLKKMLKDGKRPTVDDLANIFMYDIIPLLQEYFYDDYKKIGLVLGDDQKKDELKFIRAPYKNNDYSALFGDNTDDFDVSNVYEINEDAFKKIEAYMSI